MLNLRKIDPETYQPLGYRVLIRDEKTNDKVGSLYIPDSTKTSDEHAQQFGHVIRLGPMAFTIGSDSVRLPGSPEEGDLINFKKYGGASGTTFFEGEDGFNYRILNDDDIIGVVERASHTAPTSSKIWVRSDGPKFDVISGGAG